MNNRIFDVENQKPHAIPSEASLPSFLRAPKGSADMPITYSTLSEAEQIVSVANNTQPLQIKQYLDLAIKHQASDVHLVPGHPPVFRIDGNLVNARLPMLEPGDVEEAIFPLCSPKQKVQFQSSSEIDFSFRFGPDYSFRACLYRQQGHLAAAIRIIPCTMRSFSELGIPPVVAQLTQRRSGLILITGPSGSGKTTTLIHLVDQINRERAARIITIEDPIEFIYTSKSSLIVQREVGLDTPSFISGLKYALRQDPDVVVIGEMRDLESISMALTTAETGHLVLATLHAPGAIDAINRILDVYPGEKQNQIRIQLSETLTAIIGQQLLPRKTGTGRVLATEVCIPNLAVRNLIRRNSLSEIQGQMWTSQEGMYTLEQNLSDLASRGIISKETAQRYAKYPNLLKRT